MQQGLREVVEAFDPHIPIAEAATPPSSWYNNPEMVALERRSVFRARWVAVGRAADVATPGQYVSGSLLGEPRASLVRSTALPFRPTYVQPPPPVVMSQ